MRFELLILSHGTPQEEERLAEQRLEKRRSAGISSPMTPEEVIVMAVLTTFQLQFQFQPAQHSCSELRGPLPPATRGRDSCCTL